MAPGTTTTIVIAAATKAPNAIDLDDWRFSNLPAVVFHYVKSILFLFSASAGVVLSLALIAIVVFFIITLLIQAVTHFQNTRKKGEQNANLSESQGEAIPLQGHEMGDEDAAGQPLMAEGDDGDGDDEGQELPPKYDGRSTYSYLGQFDAVPMSDRG